MSNNVNDKSEVIAQLYENIANEITRYRDLEWKIAIWTITLLFGIISLTKFVPVPDDYKPILQVIFTTFIIVTMVFSFWHIYYCHQQLMINKRVRRRCELFLNMDGLEFNIDDKNKDKKDTEPKKYYLLEEWREKKPEDIKFTEGIIHLILWYIIIFITTLFAIIYVWMEMI